MSIITQLNTLRQAARNFSSPLDFFKVILGRPYRMRNQFGTYLLPDKYSVWLFADKDVSVSNAISKISSGIFVDVGANFGKYTVLSAKRGNKVYAIEPSPVILPYLRDNIFSNECRDVRIFPVAAWEEGGKLFFTPGKRTDRGRVGVNRSASVTVPSMRLDDILDGIIPDMIKIDVEGDEIKVMHGMRRTLDQESDMQVIFEALDQESERECTSYLSRFGFETKRLDEANCISVRS